MSAVVSKPLTLADISGTHDTGNADAFENLLDEIVVGLALLEERDGFDPYAGALHRKAKALSLMYENGPGPLAQLVYPGKAIEMLRLAENRDENRDRLGVRLTINAALHELGVKDCPTDDELEERLTAKPKASEVIALTAKTGPTEKPNDPALRRTVRRTSKRKPVPTPRRRK